MRASDVEQEHIVDYVSANFPDEEVLGVEKVKSERVIGIPRDAWNVETSKRRLWVITGPTNQYDQAQFPHLEIALSFHVGLTARVMERERQEVPRERRERFTRAWRKWQQAAEALALADEVETFQAIGLRCRESLLAFVKEAQVVVPPSDATGELKAGDFKGWSEQIAQTVIAGSGKDQRRNCIISSSQSTWDFVSWLTHSSNAIFFDAENAVELTDRALGDLTYVILRHEFHVPSRCPKCDSYRLLQIGKQLRGGKSGAFTSCQACGWLSDLLTADGQGAAVPPNRRRTKPKGECVVVEVPLRGPKPRPSNRR
jgi:hypothetical protein